MPKKEETKPEDISTVIQKKFLEERKIFLWGEVSDKSAKDITEKLLYLEWTDLGKDITFYINTMKMITSPVAVVVTGMAASMGSILLSGAAKGRRYLYPHSRVMIHQPLISGRMVAPAVDINIQAEEMEKLRHELNQKLDDASGKPLEQVENDTDRDFYLNAKEALEYGLADEIVEEI